MISIGQGFHVHLNVVQRSQVDVYQWLCKNISLRLTECWYHLTAPWYLSDTRPGSTGTDFYIINQTLSHRDTIRQFIVHAICYHGGAPSPNAKQHPPRVQTWQTQPDRAREGKGRCCLPALAPAIDCDDKVNDKSVVAEDGVEGWWMARRCWRPTDGAAAAAFQPFVVERSKRFGRAYLTRGFVTHPAGYLQQWWKLSFSGFNSCALCVYVSLRSHRPQLRRGGLVADGEPSWPVPVASASQRPTTRPRRAGLLGDWQQQRGGHRGDYCVPVKAEKFCGLRQSPRSCG